MKASPVECGEFARVHLALIGQGLLLGWKALPNQAAGPSRVDHLDRREIAKHIAPGLLMPPLSDNGCHRSIHPRLRIMETTVSLRYTKRSEQPKNAILGGLGGEPQKPGCARDGHRDRPDLRVAGRRCNARW